MTTSTPQPEPNAANRRPRPAGATAGRRVLRADVADDDIARMYRNEGRSAPEISGQLGCSTSTVYFRLAQLGIPRRPRGPRRTTRLPDSELRRLYATNSLSLRQIASQFGVSPQAVRGWLLDAGIPLRRAGAPAPTWTADDLVAQYQAGDSALQIADDVGCSTASVYRALDAAGITRRRVEPAIGRDALIDGLDRGLTAPEIAAEHAVSVACVCRALTREGLATARQTARHRSRRRLADSRPKEQAPA